MRSTTVALAAAWIAAFAAFPGCAQTLSQDLLAPPPSSGSLIPGAGETRLPGPDPRQCGSSKFEAICAQGRWTQFSKMNVHVKVAGFAGDYDLERAENNEIHVTYREAVKALRRGGEVVLIGNDGIAYRTRDVLPKPDEIIDYMLSSPVMMARLAALLLDLGVIGPPSDVVKPQSISAENDKQYLRAEAPNAATIYGPPWRMTGTVRRTEDDRVGFSLRLRYHPVDRKGNVIASKTESLELSGSVSYAPRQPKFPNTMDLIGWTVMKGSAPLGKMDTLGDARTALGL